MELSSSFIQVVSTVIGLLGTGLLAIVGLLGVARWKQLDKARKLQRTLEEKRVQDFADYLRKSKLLCSPQEWINSEQFFQNYKTTAVVESSPTTTPFVAAINLFWDQLFNYCRNFRSSQTDGTMKDWKADAILKTNPGILHEFGTIQELNPRAGYSPLRTGVEGRTAMAKMLTSTVDNTNSISRIVELPNFLSEQECDQILTERDRLEKFEKAEFGTGFHNEIDRSRKTCTAFVHQLTKIAIVKNENTRPTIRPNAWVQLLAQNCSDNSNSDDSSPAPMLEKLAKLVRPFMTSTTAYQLEPCAPTMRILPTNTAPSITEIVASTP